jgi:uracil-DNA glycosylase
MKDYGVFPFGSPVKAVVQNDRAPRSVFVLGVYASAVHAVWLGPDGKRKVNALAVASEPEIFWSGQGAKAIVDAIPVPRELGQLLPASMQFNGPSGRSLDTEFLEPLGITREKAWLSDLYPFAHMNPGQRRAIEREYLPLVEEYGLPNPTLRPAPRKGPSEDRCEEIWREITDSRASILIMLGDKPIEWFLFNYRPRYRRLADFGTDLSSYGRVHKVSLQGRTIGVLPLVHPRQASRLGTSSAEWSRLHAKWKKTIAPGLRGLGA